MGVPFRNEAEYRATLDATISNMYEGFEPTVADIELAREADDLGRPLTGAEVLAKINARNSVPNK